MVVVLGCILKTIWLIGSITTCLWVLRTNPEFYQKLKSTRHPIVPLSAGYQSIFRSRLLRHACSASFVQQFICHRRQSKKWMISVMSSHMSSAITTTATIYGQYFESFALRYIGGIRWYGRQQSYRVPMPS